MRNDFQSVLKHFKTPVVIYDIGANKGNWTRRYEALFPQHKYIQFEANPKHGPTSINRNRHNVVLSARDEQTSFFAVGGTGDSLYREKSVLYENKEPMIVDARSLDSYVEQHSLPKPKIIKMDVQGSELDILSGAKATLSDVEVIMSEVPIIEYNFGAPTFDEYINALLSLNFLPVGVDEVHFSGGRLVQQDLVFLREDLVGVYSE